MRLEATVPLSGTPRRPVIFAVVAKFKTKAFVVVGASCNAARRPHGA